MEPEESVHHILHGFWLSCMVVNDAVSNRLYGRALSPKEARKETICRYK